MVLGGKISSHSHLMHHLKALQVLIHGFVQVSEMCHTLPAFSEQQTDETLASPSLTMNREDAFLP